MSRWRTSAATDRPVGWTQHVTLGPPFLEVGQTQFRASATRSRVFEGPFGTADYLAAAAEFDWPYAPNIGGGTSDLRRYTAAPSSSAYTAHLMDPARAHAYFVAYSPAARLAFGYVWRRADFPWMGIWEENRSRTAAALEWRDADEGDGVRRVAVPGIAPADGRSRRGCSTRPRSGGYQPPPGSA